MRAVDGSVEKSLLEAAKDEAVLLGCFFNGRLLHHVDLGCSLVICDYLDSCKASICVQFEHERYSEEIFCIYNEP